MRASAIRVRLIILTAGGLLLGTMRLTPADVAAIAFDPNPASAGDVQILIASASHRFDGGPVRFGPAPGH